MIGEGFEADGRSILRVPKIQWQRIIRYMSSIFDELFEVRFRNRRLLIGDRGFQLDNSTAYLAIPGNVRSLIHSTWILEVVLVIVCELLLVLLKSLPGGANLLSLLRNLAVV
jgi:hypothetical protein